MLTSPRFRLVTALALAVMVASSALAQPPSNVESEVGQLLARLSASRCTFYRNGTWYEAAQAREHLEKKYRYLVKKKLVKTTEDFITLGGTESSMSHEPYKVRCGEQVASSRDWLTGQLSQIRNGETQP